MTGTAVIMGLIIFVCTGTGMFLGAWFAARGFEKSLVATMEDPEAPWNKDKEEQGRPGVKSPVWGYNRSVPHILENKTG